MNMSRITLLICFVCLPLKAQSIVHYSGADDAIEAQWEWALQEGGNDTFWIGYRIERLMGRRAFYGSFRGGRIEKENSLYALIDEADNFDAVLNDIRLGWHYKGNRAIRFHGDNKDEKREFILKEIGILIKYERGDLVEVQAGNMSMEFDLEGHTLFWLDRTNHENSITLLQEFVEQIADRDGQEDLVGLVGMHGKHPLVEQFAISILQNSAHPDLREQAAFVLGGQNTETALTALRNTIRNDESEDVQEHAIYALSQMSFPGAQDLLIELARNEPSKELRKKAIYGLGQIASRTALKFLEETIHDEGDAEVQNYAVHALAQFDPDTALPRLIKIANNHTHPKVRKSAIYMLGEIGNEEAVEALIEIVENQ